MSRRGEAVPLWEFYTGKRRPPFIGVEYVWRSDTPGALGVIHQFRSVCFWLGCEP